MKNKFKKITNSTEIQKLSIINDLDLSFITVPYEIIDNILYMEVGTQESRLKLDIVNLYNQCLQYIYNFHFNYYSNGIYSFYKVIPYKMEDYREFLFIQLNFLESLLLKKMETDLLEKYVKIKDVLEKYKKNASPIVTNFTVLHGDLFNGNIVKYKGKYKLIDFEYLLIGKRELELSFLLVWDFFSNKNIVQYSKVIINRDIELLFNNEIINDFEKKEIINFYIPYLFLFSCLNLTSGKYYDKESIKYCLKSVEWRIKSEIYEI